MFNLLTFLMLLLVAFELYRFIRGQEDFAYGSMRGNHIQ